MGDVYYAEDTTLHRPVAIKRLARRFGSDPEARRRILREAQRASSLTSERIASIHDVLEERGEVFVVMEYVKGETLRQRLQRPMTLVQFFQIATQCAEGLTAAHEHDIVHCDIKPENIMLTSEGQVKILDFGLAKHRPCSDQGSTLGLSSILAGTPAYMAPEVLLAQAPDSCTDLFSLGIVLYEMLTLKHPFLKGSFVATSERILHETPTAIRVFNSSVPEALEAIIMKAMAKAPAQRYATARELLEDLRRVWDGELPAKVTPLLSQRKERKVRRWLVAAVGAGILAATCASAVWFVYLKFRPPAELETLKAVPFTSYAGAEGCPAFSPDGSQIVFRWNGDPESGSQGYDLYVKVIGSENLLRLTHHPSEAICPAWSPDGTQIAFHRLSGADTGVYVVPALGGPERKLLSTQIAHERSVHISWSPDGKWIAYVESLPDERLFLLSVETLESRQIPHAAECLYEAMPAFSHNGEQLAYFCLQDAQNALRGLHTVLTVGGIPKLVTTFISWFGSQGAAAWTADDKKLVFSNTHFGENDELYEITLADGSLRKLPTAGGAFGPVISAKGDKLAYVRWISGGRYQIWRKDLLNPRVPGVKLISSSYQQRDQQYSPDGKHIAFESTRGGIREVWMCDADGTHLVQISNFKDPRTGTPHWSPDSQKIVFDTRRSDIAELYIADISERMPRKVITNIIDASLPSWSHDGKWIYFVSREAKGSGVYRCPANGGDAALLAALPPSDLNISHLEEAFDGETLYFSWGTSGKYELDMVSTKRPGTRTAVKGMPAVSWNTWTIVPGGIYFVLADAPKSLRYFDFNSKEIRPILDDERDLLSLSISPDGRWILYAQPDEDNDDIMLVDPFR
jgi:Tol biopolymer transport system component